MNKGIIAGIAISVIVIIAGVFFMSSESPQPQDTSVQTPETLSDSEPKRYSATLTESVGISTP